MEVEVGLVHQHNDQTLLIVKHELFSEIRCKNLLQIDTHKILQIQILKKVIYIIFIL